MKQFAPHRIEIDSYDPAEADMFRIEAERPGSVRLIIETGAHWQQLQDLAHDMKVTASYGN